MGFAVSYGGKQRFVEKRTFKTRMEAKKRLAFIKSRPKIRKMFPNPRIIKVNGG